jgi:hypothetical protein
MPSWSLSLARALRHPAARPPVRRRGRATVRLRAEAFEDRCLPAAISLVQTIGRATAVGNDTTDTAATVTVSSAVRQGDTVLVAVAAAPQ